MAVILAPGQRYYGVDSRKSNGGFFFSDFMVLSCLLKTPAGPTPLGSFTILDQVPPPGCVIGTAGGANVFATAWTRSTATGPISGDTAPPWQTGVWFGLRDGRPSMEIYDGRYTGEGVKTLTSDTVLDFDTCYTISFLIQWSMSPLPGPYAMDIYLGATVSTIQHIAHLDLPERILGWGNMWLAGNRDAAGNAGDGIGISLSIGSSHDPAYPQNESGYALTAISGAATSPLNPAVQLDFLGDWVPRILTHWPQGVFPDTAPALTPIPRGIHFVFHSASNIVVGYLTAGSLSPSSTPTGSLELQGAGTVTTVPNCYTVVIPPPVTDPTDPHCKPETTVNNGGKGKFGCNPGGIDHLPSYNGPWGTVPQHPDPVDGESMVNARGIDVWVEIVHQSFPAGDDTTYRRSFVDLADPSGYQGGRKASGLLGVGDIEHGLGNEQGGFEAATVDVSYSDSVDRLFRNLLTDQELEGDEVRIKIATIDGRENQVFPRTLARAVAQQPKLSSSLTASFSATDRLFSEFGPFGPSRQFPSWPIPPSIFTSAPYDSLQLPIPVIYGEKSDEGAHDPLTGAIHPKGLVPLIYVGQQSLHTAGVSSSVPPFDGTIVPPSSSNVSYLLYPLGTVTFTQSIASNPAVTNYVANLYVLDSGLLVDTIDLGLPVADSNGGIAVDLKSWLDSHGAGDYDLTVWAYNGEGGAESMVSNQFTIPLAPETSGGGVGWYGPVNSDPFFAIMTVYRGNGSSLVLKRGPIVTYDATPHNFRVTWTAAPLAAEYLVFMYTAGSSWDAYTNPSAAATVRYKRVPASPTNSQDAAWDYFVDFTSPTDGATWPPTPVDIPAGNFMWDCYLVAGHAVFDIISVYGSDLKGGGDNADPTRIRLDPNTRGDILVPFFNAWPFPTTYRDFTADDGSVYRLTVIYAIGPLSDAHKNGEITMTANVIGIEDQGDGLGLPLTDAQAVQQHWLENYCINNYKTGLWTSDGTFPQWEDGTPIVRSSSFAEVQAFSVSRLGDRGLTVGWYAGTAKSLQDWFREWNQSTDTRLGINAHGQIMVKALDETVDTTDWPRVIHEVDLFGDVVQTFGDERENVVSGVCDWDPDTDLFRGKTQTFASERSITKYKNRRKEGTAIQSTILIEARQLQWVLQRRLARLQDGTKTVEIVGKVDLLDYDIGSGILLTTIEGPGALGYVDAPMLILRRRFSVSDRLVTLTLLNFGAFAVTHDQVFAIGNDESGSPDDLGNPIGTEGDSVLVTV